MFQVEFVPSALEDLQALPKAAQQTVLNRIEEQLTVAPTTVTRNRKHLRANPLSTWELRVGKYRVFYNVGDDAQVVTITAIGCKEHNKLYIRGREFKL
jgi:mRNA-degrading endonuclease RelE of RelBE toxin-antitoxin system